MIPVSYRTVQQISYACTKLEPFLPIAVGMLNQIDNNQTLPSFINLAENQWLSVSCLSRVLSIAPMQMRFPVVLSGAQIVPKDCSCRVLHAAVKAQHVQNP